METASQTERDGKEQSGNNATVVHGNFPQVRSIPE